MPPSPPAVPLGAAFAYHCITRSAPSSPCFLPHQPSAAVAPESHDVHPCHKSLLADALLVTLSCDHVPLAPHPSNIFARSVFVVPAYTAEPEPKQLRGEEEGEGGGEEGEGERAW